tara:strand:- start:21744 stop:23291 length:1548 start_codon:yes stop_codon:yes gene_type:complete
MKKLKIKEYNAAYDLIKRNILNNADKIAFIDNNIQISYKKLNDKVQKFSNSILELNLKKNDRVILCMHDSIYYPISFLGCIWAGIIPICINTMLPEKDYQYMLEDSEAKAVISSNSIIKTFINLDKKLKLNILFISEHEFAKNINSITSMISSKNNIKLEPAKTYENDVCFWLYSSGSTGSPKGTLHIHKNLIATANTYAKNVIRINSNDICFSAAKLFFAYGLGNALTFPMSVGATSVLNLDRPTPELVSQIIQKYRVTIFFGVPTLYAAMLNSDSKLNNYSSLRLSVSAGEALPPHLCKKWYNSLGTKVLDGIGSTEMLHIFISNTIEDTTPGTSGKIVPGYEARVVNDNGLLADDDEIGELEIKGPSSAIAYWNKPDKSKVTFKDSWTKTGDKYIKNKEGIFTYCGRVDDMMKVSGQYVSPFEVEASLQTHESVLEAAVVACKDKDDLIKPKAFIILNSNYTASKELELSLNNHVKSQLTPFKYPRWYKFVKELPKTATGKIQRYKLRDNNE